MLPHGQYTLVPAVLCTMAWLSALFQDNCNYSRLTGGIVASIATAADTPWLEVGLSAYREPIYNEQAQEWQVVYTGECLEYPADLVEQDTVWTAAKAFAFIADVLGGGGTFFLWFSTCCIFGRATWRWAGYEVLGAALFQSLSFIWFATAICHDESETSCDLFWGSKADILASILWTLAAMCIFCYYPVPKEYDEDTEDGIMVDLHARPTTRPSTAVVDARGDQSLQAPTVTTEGAATSSDFETQDFAHFDDANADVTNTTTTSSVQDSRQDGVNKDMDDVEII